MHWIDLTLFAVYVAIMLGIGYYFFRKNKGIDDYYVGGLTIWSLHVGLSVVATDEGGGFSIEPDVALGLPARVAENRGRLTGEGATTDPLSFRDCFLPSNDIHESPQRNMMMQKLYNREGCNRNRNFV